MKRYFVSYRWTGEDFSGNKCEGFNKYVETVESYNKLNIRYLESKLVSMFGYESVTILYYIKMTEDEIM